jgi:hypothetical protein
MKRYPAIEIVVRYGRLLSVVAGVAFAMLAMVGYLSTGSTLGLAVGMVGAFLGYVIFRVGAELVEVVADTLMPK